MSQNEHAQRRERVAVIAVHGVADQREGDTARALTELLERLPPESVRYDTAREQQAFMLVAEPVKSLRELSGAAGPPADKPRMLSADWWKKAWRQSYGSDFHRDDWAVESRDTQDTIAVDRPQRAGLRPGPDLTEFMLYKARRNGAQSETWRSRALSMPRHDGVGGCTAQVDVYEMYWADLSRLASSLPRIVTELFTLLFRLSALGRDTVRIALATRQYSGGAWPLLRKSQTTLDWLFSRVLALLTLQLAMLALVVLPMGLLERREHFVAPLLSGGTLFVGYVLFCYAERPPWLRSIGVALVCAMAAVLVGRWASDSPRAEWLVGIVWLAVLTTAYVPFTRAIDARFPFTAPIAWAMWLVVLAGLLGSAAADFQTYQGLAMWTLAALRVVEVLLVLIIIVWTLIGTTMAVWLVAGSLAVRASRTPEAYAIVSTGRLGVFASGSFFLLLVMLLWALLSGPLELAAGAHGYVPLLFNVDGLAPSATLAREFLDSRYRGSTEFFPLIAMIDLLLLGYIVVFFMPSALAELKPRTVKLDAGRLGRWLSAGYDHLDTHPVRWLSLLSAGAGAFAAASLSWWLMHRLQWVGAPPKFAMLAEFSHDVLAPFVIGAGSLTVALSAFGGLLSRYLPGLRAPLDIALDVDNHFREFPRTAIPRARIVARYLALLRHVDAQGYDRIVIVAHSQGSVITTELLRYMRQRARVCRWVGVRDPDAELVARIAAKTRLLTLGCPLRQLYATRFPTLYPWVLRSSGPRASDLGVQRWVNGYTTGDYVGRWLWSADSRRYATASREAVRAELAGDASEIDVCLGAGAHTHYFDVDPKETTAQAAKVVDLVDALIR
jgi:hypothetical protein